MIEYDRANTSDASCRRCDDSGVVPGGGKWTPCTCFAGAIVLDQLAAKQAIGAR